MPDDTEDAPRSLLRQRFDASIFVVQLLCNPAILLPLVMLFSFPFPGNPLLLERDGVNNYRPSPAGSVILIVLCVAPSLALLRLRFGRWWAADAVTAWMLPANAVAAVVLWSWIEGGLEGNVVGFIFLPALVLATLYWFICLGRCPGAPLKF